MRGLFGVALLAGAACKPVTPEPLGARVSAVPLALGPFGTGGEVGLSADEARMVGLIEEQLGEKLVVDPRLTEVARHVAAELLSGVPLEHGEAIRGAWTVGVPMVPGVMLGAARVPEGQLPDRAAVWAGLIAQTRTPFGVSVGLSSWSDGDQRAWVMVPTEGRLDLAVPVGRDAEPKLVEGQLPVACTAEVLWYPAGPGLAGVGRWAAPAADGHFSVTIPGEARAVQVLGLFPELRRVEVARMFLDPQVDHRQGYDGAQIVAEVADLRRQSGLPPLDPIAAAPCTPVDDTADGVALSREARCWAFDSTGVPGASWAVVRQLPALVEAFVDPRFDALHVGVTEDQLVFHVRRRFAPATTAFARDRAEELVGKALGAKVDPEVADWLDAQLVAFEQGDYVENANGLRDRALASPGPFRKLPKAMFFVTAVADNLDQSLALALAEYKRGKASRYAVGYRAFRKDGAHLHLTALLVAED